MEEMILKWIGNLAPKYIEKNKESMADDIRSHILRLASEDWETELKPIIFNLLEQACLLLPDLVNDNDKLMKSGPSLEQLEEMSEEERYGFIVPMIVGGLIVAVWTS